MLELLASADPVTWMSILLKALVYLMTLLAIGSVLAVLTLRRLPAAEVQMLKRFAAACALGAAVLSVLRLPVRASFLMGGTWAGAIDPVMLGFVADSPLGNAVAMRLVGLAMVLSILAPSWFGRWVAVLGVLTVALSFAQRGHALEEPRMVLAVLVTAHILGLAFWIGAFVPLYRAAGGVPLRDAGRLANDFGRTALWVVAGLAVAGLSALFLLTGGGVGTLGTPYGQYFALKLGLFCAVLGLAAWNKLRLTPALLRADPEAGRHLRRSVTLEAGLIGLILIVTSTLSTLSAP